MFVMRKIRKAGEAKLIHFGSRNVYFSKKEHRKTADIMSLGKHALMMYDHIRRHGPKLTEELDRELGVGYGSLRTSAANLVNSGYLKMSRTDYKRGGNLYYIDITNEERTRKSIGYLSSAVYGVIKSSKLPISRPEIAAKIRAPSGGILNAANNLVERGLAYRPMPSEGRKGFRQIHYCSDERQLGLAAVMSVSPKYGARIYRQIKARPRVATEISSAAGVDLVATRQVLNYLDKHGLIESERKGSTYEVKWSLGKDSPKI